jgi:acyl dehydratase
MTSDPSVTGRSYAHARSYEVGREKIREFADAIGDPDPLYRDPDAAHARGYADVLAPPTFTFVLTLSGWHVIMDDLGIDVARVLHVDQRFVYQRRLVAGDVIRASATVESVRERMGASFLVIRTDVVDATDEIVSSGYSTIMVRSGEEGA